MGRHRLLKVAAATLMTCALVAGPVLASCCYVREQFLVFLPGIDPNGCPLFDEEDLELGDFVVVTSLVNTCTGKFCFSARGCVVNESCHCQSYCDENFFVTDLTDAFGEPSDVEICRSCYVVSKPCKCISRVCYSGFADDPDYSSP